MLIQELKHKEHIICSRRHQARVIKVWMRFTTKRKKNLCNVMFIFLKIQFRVPPAELIALPVGCPVYWRCTGVHILSCACRSTNQSTADQVCSLVFGLDHGQSCKALCLSSVDQPIDRRLQWLYFQLLAIDYPVDRPLCKIQKIGFNGYIWF